MAELGTAYVSVIPKMAGNIKSIIQKDMAVAGKSGGVKFAKSFGSSSANALKGVMKAVVAGAAVKEIGSMGKAALDAYANFEQLQGGTELLFGKASDEVMEYAKNAFSTVQMSANDYLEQANFYATGLKTALGGDEHAAAELSNKIITAQADIVAATGASTESIANAFQGVMKGNYSMLDNLQLGIKPTKEGMQEVIDKMNEWNEAQGNSTNYQMDNYADMEAALADYVEWAGLAGYAQGEAADTIQGSLAQMSAAWENWLVALGSGEDLSEVTDQLFESLVNAAKQVIPRIGDIFGNLGTVIKEKLPEIKDQLESELLNLVPSDWMSTITGAFDTLDVLGEKASAFVEEVGGYLEDFGEENGPYLQATFSDIMSFAVEAFDAITDAVRTAMPIIKATVQIAMTVVRGAFNGLRGIVSIVSGIFKAIVTAMTDPIGTAKGVIKGIVDTIKGFFNFSVPTPSIPLPHFSINPPGWKVGDLLKGKIPSLGIQWYAKGGIFDGASLIGVGERGAEAVVPLTSDRMKPFAKAIADAGGAGGIVINLAYDASADAAQMANELAREVKRAMRRG